MGESAPRRKQKCSRCVAFIVSGGWMPDVMSDDLYLLARLRLITSGVNLSVENDLDTFDINVYMMFHLLSTY